MQKLGSCTSFCTNLRTQRSQPRRESGVSAWGTSVDVVPALGSVARWRAVVVPGALLAFAACGGGGGDDDAAPTTAAPTTAEPSTPGSDAESTTSTTPAPGEADFLTGGYACSLITQDEMSAAFGRPSGPLEPNGGRLLSVDNGDTSNCRVASEDGQLITQYTIWRGHEEETVAAHWPNVIGPPGNIPALPGVGDEAVIVLSAGGAYVYALNDFEVLSINTIVDTSVADADPAFNTDPATIEAARVIASRMGSGASSVVECAVDADGLIPEDQRLSADDLAFEADDLEGHYEGSWTNDTFGTEGTVEADVSFDLDDRTVTIEFAFDGDTLGTGGDGPAETVVIEVDRPVTHVDSDTFGDLVITRPLGGGCPTGPTDVAAEAPADDELEGVGGSVEAGGGVVAATYEVTYPNGTSSTGSFTLQRD